MKDFIPELENRIGSIHDYSNLTLRQVSLLLPKGEEMLKALEQAFPSVQETD